MSARTEKRSRGFTLIELLIVVSLMGVVFLAVYGAISAGVGIWKRLSEDERTGDLMLARKRFQKDLRGTLRYKALPLVGGASEVSFAALVPVDNAEDEGDGAATHNEIGRIRYYQDAAGRRICRERLTYAQVLKGTGADCFPVFSSVTAAAFEYFGRESEAGGAGAWVKEWRRDFPPLAVRLKVTVANEGGGTIEKQLTTLLP